VESLFFLERMCASLDYGVGGMSNIHRVFGLLPGWSIHQIDTFVDLPPATASLSSCLSCFACHYKGKPFRTCFVFKPVGVSSILFAGYFSMPIVHRFAVSSAMTLAKMYPRKLCNQVTKCATYAGDQSAVQDL
jgi:hypothetical protein